jgi:SAM-dependent methyltransferase
MNDTKRKELEDAFYARIPKARRASPVFQKLFDLMYKAHLYSVGKRVLSIYASHDKSGEREAVYREKFFNDCDYVPLDFWRDQFFLNDVPSEPDRHHMPFKNGEFDMLVTTKYLLEHISEPDKVIHEMARVLKPGGEAFVIAAHVRRQHQAPYDYFRFTEFALEYLFKKAGFKDVRIIATNGGFVTLTYYSYFLQRQTPMPKIVENFFDFIYYWVVEPVGFFLDRFDNGKGRDLSLYFYVHAKK